MLSLVGAGVGVFAINQMSRLSAAANDIFAGSLVPTQNLATVAVDMGAMRATVLNHALSTDDAAMDKYEAAMKAGDARFDEHVAAYRADTADPALLDRLDTAWQQYRTIRDEQAVPVWPPRPRR